MQIHCCPMQLSFFNFLIHIFQFFHSYLAVFQYTRVHTYLYIFFSEHQYPNRTTITDNRLTARKDDGTDKRTCMADIPTNELRMLSNKRESRLVMMSIMSIPLVLKTASHFSIALAKIGMFNSCLPMPSHCDPMPENTNHTGGFSFVMGCNRKTKTSLKLLENRVENRQCSSQTITRPTESVIKSIDTHVCIPFDCETKTTFVTEN